MQKYKSLLKVLFVIGLVPSVYANECAEISTTHVPMNKDIRYLILTEHNGERLGKHMFTEPAGITRGRPTVLQLAPGRHEFKAFAGNDGFPCGSKVSASSSAISCGNGSQSTQIGEFNFSIDVEANTRYRLIAKRNYPKTVVGNKQFRAEILNITENQCQESNQDDIYEPMLQEQILVNSSKIPDEMKFEFDQVMLEISVYYRAQNITGGIVNLHRESVFDGVYGLFGEFYESDGVTGLRVTDIEQGSSAESIGLQMNDIILAHNGKNISGTNLEKVSEQLAKVDNHESYTLSIERKGKRIELTDTYRPNLLTGFNLNIDLSSANLANGMLTKLANSSRHYRRKLEYHYMANSPNRRMQMQRQNTGMDRATVKAEKSKNNGK